MERFCSERFFFIVELVVKDFFSLSDFLVGEEELSGSGGSTHKRGVAALGFAAFRTQFLAIWALLSLDAGENVFFCIFAHARVAAPRDRETLWRSELQRD